MGLVKKRYSYTRLFGLRPSKLTGKTGPSGNPGNPGEPGTDGDFSVSYLPRGFTEKWEFLV